MHTPVRCRGCDAELAEAKVVGTAARQVFDVGDPRRVVVEHRVQRRRCGWMREAADALVGFLAAVAARLQAAPVVHADETSVRSGRKALWFHVCCTQMFTLLHVGRRDKATIETGPLGAYTGTIAHDRLPHYFNYGTGHVLCNAHILRSLNELPGNHHQQRWAQAFIELIVETKHKVDTAAAANKTSLSAGQRYRIRKRWDDLCTQAARAAPPAVTGTKLYGTNKAAHNLAVALSEHRDLSSRTQPTSLSRSITTPRSALFEW